MTFTLYTICVKGKHQNHDYNRKEKRLFIYRKLYDSRGFIKRMVSFYVIRK